MMKNKAFNFCCIFFGIRIGDKYDLMIAFSIKKLEIIGHKVLFKENMALYFRLDKVKHTHNYTPI